MKWLIACLVALFMVTPALAGQDPYVAVVGNDIGANGFYLSPKYEQFLYDQVPINVPLTGEVFSHNDDLIQPEICDELGVARGTFGNYDCSGDTCIDAGNPNFRVDAGNEGWFDWTVRLPKKPDGEINLCIQCGVLKTDAFHFWGYGAINNCAAETGERVAENCSAENITAGTNPLIVEALPKISATAAPGNSPTPGFTTPFNLTAYRNPGTYDPFSGSVMVNGAAGQILNGADDGTRILLKTCMDKCIVVKLPVTGQINAAGQREYDLRRGDLIRVRMTIPDANTVDIYCHQESLKVMGLGISNY